ncbi:MAG: macro domain-containing protein [Candidatus Hodarchaeota archaeon]
MISEDNLKYKEADILKSRDQTLVNTVNIVGVMGKGLAKQFKQKYPKMYEKYREKCKNREITIGKSFLYKDETPWVLNFPTKKHWRGKSKLEYIESGLEEFITHYKDWGIESISFPQLGCKNGGLEWFDVKPLMEGYLHKLDIPVTIYIYSEPSEPTLSVYLEEASTMYELPARWKLTANKSGYYYSRGKITIFWDLGSSEVKVKINKPDGIWEQISVIKLHSNIPESIEESIQNLNSLDLLLDENLRDDFRREILDDLQIIKKETNKKFKTENLENILNNISPNDFYFLATQAGFQQD